MSLHYPFKRFHGRIRVGKRKEARLASVGTNGALTPFSPVLASLPFYSFFFTIMGATRFGEFINGGDGSDAMRRQTDTRYASTVAGMTQGVEQGVTNLHLDADVPSDIITMEGKTLRAETKNGVTVARITTRELIDASQLADFRADLENLNNSASNIVIDFSDVEFIASSFLNALIILDKRVKSKGGVLKLAGMCLDIREVFVITRLNQLFDICDTVDQAVSAITDVRA